MYHEILLHPGQPLLSCGTEPQRLHEQNLDKAIDDEIPAWSIGGGPAIVKSVLAGMRTKSPSAKRTTYGHPRRASIHPAFILADRQDAAYIRGMLP